MGTDRGYQTMRMLWRLRSEPTQDTEGLREVVRDKLASSAGRSKRKRKRNRGEPHPLNTKKRRAPKAKPNPKGGKFERDIAAKFSAWYGCTVVRTPRSGGWHSAEIFDMKGDLVFHEPNAPYHVECKNREGWLLSDLVTGKRSQGTRSIEGWWEQTTRTCPDGKMPMLVFTRNQQPVYLMVYEGDLWKKFGAESDFWEFIPHFNIENDRSVRRTVMQFDDFLKRIAPHEGAPGRKTWERGRVV